MKPIDQELLAVLGSRDSIAKKIPKVRDLIARGANVNVKGEYGLTPLHRAAQNRTPGSVELATLLLDAGANPNPTGAEVTPFENAIEGNDDVPAQAIDVSIALMDLLLARGAKLPKKWPLADFCCASSRIFDKVWKLGASPDLGASQEGTVYRKPAIVAVVLTQRPALLAALLAKGVLVPASLLAIAKAGDEYSAQQKKNKQQILALLAKAAPAAAASAATQGPDPEALIKEYQRKPHVTAIVSEIAKLLGKPAKRNHTGDLDVDAAMVHHGDLKVKGNLAITAPFVVTGSVTVSGVTTDCGPDSWVVIGGNFETRALFTDGEFCVVGAIAATDLVYGHYNDNSLRAKSIKSRVVIADDHDIDAKVAATDVYFEINKYRQGRGKGVQAKLEQLFSPDVMGDEGFDHEAAAERLCANKSIWRKR
jgi:hypothetical protein